MSAEVLAEVGKLWVVVAIEDMDPSGSGRFIGKSRLYPLLSDFSSRLGRLYCLGDSANHILLEYSLEGCLFLLQTLMMSCSFSDDVVEVISG